MCITNAFFQVFLEDIGLDDSDYNVGVRTTDQIRYLVDNYANKSAVCLIFSLKSFSEGVFLGFLSPTQEARECLHRQSD